MKFFRLTLTMCFFLTIACATVQEISYKDLFGHWEYDNVQGKVKLSYNFARNKKFTSIMESNAIEQKTTGDFLLEKKGGLDRLKLISTVEEFKGKTHITYYFIKFLGRDTLKTQKVTDKQTQWMPETVENTLVFVRKKEKPKEEGKK